MKCKTHDRYTVLWHDPCVKKRVPNFWERIPKIAWLIGIESSITSLGKVKIQQTKEKFGSTRIYYSFSSSCGLAKEGFVTTCEKDKDVTEPHKIPKYIWRAMERQRRLNPDIAHYTYDFAPYKCNCKDDFWCELYAHVNPLKKFCDRVITKALGFYGNHSSRWEMLKGGFVLCGRQWGPAPNQKTRRTLKKPF